MPVISSPKYGLMVYEPHPFYNVGDYIQSLAAAQYLPHVDEYLNREQLFAYKGEKIKMILNGWFMHRPCNWPPSEKIDPLLLSFHLNSQAREKLLSDKGLTWFKKHEPVGCRDVYTLESMQGAGIKSYLSGCLTTTFDNAQYSGERTDDIFFVDVLFNVPGWRTMTQAPGTFIKAIVQGNIVKMGKRERILRNIFNSSLLGKSITIEHYCSPKHTEQQRFDNARRLLRKYATARLVVTSRLHCALPCLAFGTPVIFVDCGFTKSYDQCRLKGVTDLFNTISIDEHERVTTNFPLPVGKIDADFTVVNPTEFEKYRTEIKERCANFVNEPPFAI